MIFQKINTHNRKKVNQFIEEQWFSTDMVIRGKIVDMTSVDGFFIEQGGNIAALITYIINGGICEITSLNSLIEGKGIGSSLVEDVIASAKKHKCKKIIVVTTNDNIGAIRFYQKRGFEIARLYRNSLNKARELKPSIPLIGDNGIPLMHEIEFEMIL